MKVSSTSTSTKLIALFSNIIFLRPTTPNAFTRSLARTIITSSSILLYSSSDINSLNSINTRSTQNNKNNNNNIKMSVTSQMQRGHNGRIEEAFAQCKEKGEAAFVTFVTAGFPSKEGKEGVGCVVIQVGIVIMFVLIFHI